MIKEFFLAFSLLVAIANAGRRTCFCRLKGYDDYNAVYDYGLDFAMADRTSCHDYEKANCRDQCRGRCNDLMRNPTSICNSIGHETKRNNIDVGFTFKSTRSYSSCEGWIDEDQDPRRICCERQCDCEIIFKSNKGGGILKNKINLNSLGTQTEYRNGYRAPWREYNKCGSAFGSCMDHCRKQLSSFFQIDIGQFSFTSSTLNDMNLLYPSPTNSSSIAAKLCEQTGHSPNPGNSVFVKYNAVNAPVPNMEELFIGNLCCIDLATLGITGLAQQVVQSLECPKNRLNDL